MSLVDAVVKARSNMEPLLKDKSVKTGAYSFKYASLQAVLDVVEPALLAEGVLLTQDVQSSGKNAWCTTTLRGEGDEKLESGQLSLDHDGTQAGLGKALTTLRRYQLLGFLGLTAEEDEGGQGAVPGGNPPVRGSWQPTARTPLANEAREGAAPQQVREPVPVVQVPGSAGVELLRRSARKGQNLAGEGATPELHELALKVRNSDARDGEPFATTVATGKKISMYDYYKNVVESVVGKGNGEMVLSLLYGRLVSLDAPPTANTKFLYDEIAEGNHKSALGEARGIVSK